MGANAGGQADRREGRRPYGPAAAALSPKPADLSQFTRRHGGAAFPSKDFEDKLNGMAMSPAYGSTDMPVWGPIVRQMGNDQLRIYNLKSYVESLQVGIDLFSAYEGYSQPRSAKASAERRTLA